MHLRKELLNELTILFELNEERSELQAYLSYGQSLAPRRLDKGAMSVHGSRNIDYM